MSQTYAQQRARQVEWWGDRFPPACECGCGEPVKMGSGGPLRFANRAHDRWWREANGVMRKMQVAGGEGWHQKHGQVDIEKFRAACRKIKQNKGWTWEQMAEKGGWSKGQLFAYMWGKRYRGIGEDIAREFLRRLADMGAPMSTYQRRMDKERAMNRHIAESQIRNSHMKQGERS